MRARKAVPKAVTFKGLPFIAQLINSCVQQILSFMFTASTKMFSKIARVHYMHPHSKAPCCRLQVTDVMLQQNELPAMGRGRHLLPDVLRHLRRFMRRLQPANRVSSRHNYEAAAAAAATDYFFSSGRAMLTEEGGKKSEVG